MALQITDIKFLSSGDSGLGGPISNIELENRLFKDVSEVEADKGNIDYKCLYIKNINSLDSMYRFSVNATDRGQSDILLGFPGVFRCTSNSCTEIFDFSREEQILTFNYKKNITGSFELRYNQKRFTITWDSAHMTNPGHSLYLPSQIKKGIIDPAGLDLLDNENNLECTIYEDNNCGPDRCILKISLKYPKGRYYDFLILVTGAVVFQDPDSIFFSDVNFSLTNTRQKKGGPINLVADTIENTKNIPKFDGSNIEFFNNSESIQFEELKAGEFIPVWVKRVVPPSSSKVSEDAFTLNITAYSTLETTIPPTTLPFVTVQDQAMEITNDMISTIPGKFYWQYFKAGFTGKLRNVELGFSRDQNGALSGQGRLRIYKGDSSFTPPQSSNLMYSGSINVSIPTNGFVNWNNYELSLPSSFGLDILEDNYYIIAYYPNFIHKILTNNSNCYICGVHGVDSVIQINKDMLFRTFVYTNMEVDSDTTSCSVCL